MKELVLAIFELEDKIRVEIDILDYTIDTILS